MIILLWVFRWVVCCFHCGPECAVWSHCGCSCSEILIPVTKTLCNLRLRMSHRLIDSQDPVSFLAVDYMCVSEQIKQGISWFPFCYIRGLCLMTCDNWPSTHLSQWKDFLWIKRSYTISFSLLNSTTISISSMQIAHQNFGNQNWSLWQSSNWLALSCTLSLLI